MFDANIYILTVANGGKRCLVLDELLSSKIGFTCQTSPNCDRANDGLIDFVGTGIIPNVIILDNGLDRNKCVKLIMSIAKMATPNEIIVYHFDNNSYDSIGNVVICHFDCFPEKSAVIIKNDISQRLSRAIDV